MYAPIINYKCIACVGDSITAGCFDESGMGWVSHLSCGIADSFSGQHIVHNFGFSNDTTMDALSTFNFSVSKIIPNLIIFHMGVNDTNIKQTDIESAPRMSLAESATKWINLLQKAKDRTKNVLVVSPLPVPKGISIYPAYPDNPSNCQCNIYTNEKILPYVNMLENMCQEKQVSFLRLYESWLGKDDCYADGLHPNAKGHKILAGQILQGIKDFGLL